MNSFAVEITIGYKNADDRSRVRDRQKKARRVSGLYAYCLEASKITTIATKLLYFWQNRATLVGGTFVTVCGIARNLLLRLLKRRLPETALTAGCQTINTL